MKEIWKKKKIFVITIALMVGIIGTAATFAIITATAGTVTNTFQAAKVATEIEEEFEGKIKAGSTVKKNPSVKNTGISDVFVRVRITISPEQTEVTQKKHGLAVLTMSVRKYLRILTMWHWDTSTDLRKWGERPCVTVGRRLSILFRKQIIKNR